VLAISIRAVGLPQRAAPIYYPPLLALPPPAAPSIAPSGERFALAANIHLPPKRPLRPDSARAPPTTA
jgi:hypothetical protein